MSEGISSTLQENLKIAINAPCKDNIIEIVAKQNVKALEYLKSTKGRFSSSETQLRKQFSL